MTVLLRSLTIRQQRQVLQLLAPVGVIVLCSFAAAHFSRDLTLAVFFENLHWSIAYITAALLAWLGVAWADESALAPRRWFAYGLSSYALGQLAWDFQVLTGWTPFPGPVDVLFLCLGFCITWGLVLAIRQQSGRFGMALLLDTAMLTVVVLAIALVCYLPHRDDGNPLLLATLIAYPISMLSGSCLAAIMMPTLRLQISSQWLLLILACMTHSLLSMRGNLQILSGSIVPGSWLGLGYSLTALAMGLGACIWRTQPTADAAWLKRYARMLNLLPLLLISVAAISIYLGWRLDSLSTAAEITIYISTAVVLALATLRQSLLLFERERLLAAEQRAVQLESRFHTLFKNTRSGLALLNSNGHFMEVNPGLSQLLGYNPSELLHMNIRDIDTTQPLSLDGPLGLVDHQGSGVIETGCRHKNGQLIELELTSALIPDTNGQVFVILRNITERKQANEQLQLMAQRLAIATRSAGIGIWEYQPPTDTLVWDAQMHSLYDIASEDFPGTYAAWEQRVELNDRQRMHRMYEEALQGLREYQGEFRIRHANGEVRYIETFADIQRDAHNKPTRIIGVNWDITARKQAEAVHLQLETQLRQSQKLEAIGTLASGIAHDFNNILGAILGNIELALEDVNQTHAAHTSMQEIRKAGQRARDLVRRIVAFGKSEQADFHTTQLDAVITDALKMVRAMLPASVEIDCRLATDTPPVRVDSAQIAQLLLNLCTNAYQAMPQQRGRIELALQPHEFHAATLPSADIKPGRYLGLTITDTGTGIDPMIVDRIFEPFFTTRATGEGSGLGLAIAHNIVRNHGGAIALDSRPGGGTRCQIYLPVLEASETTPLRQLAGDNRPGKGQHVLYVDDEEPLVFLTKRMLERFGYRVTGFTEAATALQAALADTADFDVIITDQSMPGMSGIDLARELLKQRAHSRILLVSGYLPPRDVERARAVGIQEILLKPDTIDELVNTVHRMINNDKTAPN
ncbi:MAG: PAS domain S-box protein [Steroidobacteraceae bacterium]